MEKEERSGLQAYEDAQCKTDEIWYKEEERTDEIKKQFSEHPDHPISSQEDPEERGKRVSTDEETSNISNQTNFEDALLQLQRRFVSGTTLENNDYNEIIVKKKIMKSNIQF